MKSIFADFVYRILKDNIHPVFCQYYVPVAQRQSNILKKVGLQLKPHWYCCKKLNNSCV